MPDPKPNAKVDLKQWFAAESWVSITAIGPTIASISVALTVNLGSPSGWNIMVVSIIFAAALPLVHSDRKGFSKLATFAAGALLIFLQAAGSSTIIGHTSADLSDNAMHLGESLCSVFIHPASAKDRSPTFTATTRDEDAPVPLGWVCETIPEGYVLTSPGTGAPIVIPWLAANALLDHIAHNKARDPDIKKQSPWRIRFSK